MITRIEVDGFKSLRGFSLDLEPFTAIVGANGAGKSNLLDALSLLSRLAQTNVTEALKAGRGAIRDQFARSQSGAEARIRLCTELLSGPEGEADPFLDGEAPSRVRHEIEIQRVQQPSGVEELSISRESVTLIQRNEDAWMAAHPAFASLAREHGWMQDHQTTLEPHASKKSKRILTISARKEGETYSLPIEVDDGWSVLSRWPNPYSQLVSEKLRSIRFVHLEPSRLRLPSDRAAGATLAPDGSNLPTALAALAPDARLQLRADLAELIPGFRSFEVVPSDEELRLEIELTDGARVPARVLSDGTLRLVALLTMLRGAKPGALIAVEEPENGIYPGRLRALIEKLIDATAPGSGALPQQVLLTSHSPAILAALHDRPETLVLADQTRRGADLRSTRMRRVLAGERPLPENAASIREIERILEAARPEEEA